MDGQEVDWESDIVTLAEAPGMAYHWTQDHSVPPPDPDWWMKGLDEPKPRERAYEWHEREWESPEVLAIRGAYREAAERHEP